MSAIYHRNNTSSLKGLWTEKFRPDLHNPSNWCRRLNGSDDKVSLSYVPTSIGFSGSSQLSQFASIYPTNEHIFKNFDDAQSVSVVIDENTGRFCDEFILSWTQKTPKMEYLFADQCLPLQKYKLSFIITGQIDLSERLLKSVRIHWDQSNLILQAGLLLKAFRSVLKPGTSSDVFESCISTLPINSGDYNQVHIKYLPSEKVNGFGINTISSILTDLPASTSGPAVSTPQLPARSRSINPALLNSLKFGDDLPFDSPLPANVRSVKSRNVSDETVSSGIVDQKRKPPQQLATSRKLFEEMSSTAERLYSPIMQPNATHSKQLQSHIFDEYPKNTPRVTNQALTDKNLFESHVFDSQETDLPGEKRSSVASGPPPSGPSHLITPAEDMMRDPKGSQPASSTLSRPGMQGHFKGAAIGESHFSGDRNGSAFPENYRPSTRISFDPNRSQFSLNGEDSENSSSSGNNSLKTLSKHSYDPNRSQISLGGQDNINSNVSSTRPSSRIMSPPGGKSTIEL